MKIVINNLTEDHAQIVRRALDLYSRILCGQLDEVLFTIQREHMKNMVITPYNDDYANARKHIKHLKKVLFPELDKNTSYGIAGEKTNFGAQLAYEMLVELEIGLGNRMSDNKLLSVSGLKMPEVRIEE
jgi:hypothetical protein